MTSNQLPSHLNEVAADQPYPLLFATVSGAHLYGFPSPDSDWDVRGVHVLPAREVLGLQPGHLTIDRTWFEGGIEYDLVTHDVGKFFGLLLKKGGAVLEQLYSPLVVTTSPEHEQLKEIVRGCITKHHVHHYAGFATTQWKLFAKETPPRVKPLLYTFRVLLTGIHLMRFGEVEANLTRLINDERLAWLDELVAVKVGGVEKQTINDDRMPFYEAEFNRLTTDLENASVSSLLPESASKASREALNELLIDLRLRSVDR